MKKLTAIVSLAVALTTLGAVQFMATPVKAESNHVCYNFGWAYKGCVPATAAGLTFAKYPSRIVVRSEADWMNVNAGWTGDRNCQRPTPEMMSKNGRVNVAKLLFCQFTKQGVPVAKPDIVTGW